MITEFVHNMMELNLVLASEDLDELCICVNICPRSLTSALILDL